MGIDILASWKVFESGVIFNDGIRKLGRTVLFQCTFYNFLFEDKWNKGSLLERMAESEMKREGGQGVDHDPIKWAGVFLSKNNNEKERLYLPQCGHGHNSVPKGCRNGCEVGVFNIFLGVEHDSSKYNDGHGKRKYKKA